jgi:hypothetical protein
LNDTLDEYGTGLKEGSVSFLKSIANMVSTQELWKQAGVDTAPSGESLVDSIRNHSGANFAGRMTPGAALFLLPELFPELLGPRLETTAIRTAEGVDIAEGAATDLRLGTTSPSPGVNLLDRATALRQELGVGGGRNLAVAQYEIDGATGELVGVSGKAARPGTVPTPSDHVFETIQTGNNPRLFDAENKILEHLSGQLQPTSQGVIRLHSGLDVCVSCNSVIQQFQQKFPGIRIIVTTGKP